VRKNIVQLDRQQKTIWLVGIAWWIPKAKDKHSEYVILIAFPRQQLLRESASVLRYMACLVIFIALMLKSFAISLTLPAANRFFSRILLSTCTSCFNIRITSLFSVQCVIA